MVIHKLVVTNSGAQGSRAPYYVNVAVRDFWKSLSGVRTIQTVGNNYESYNITGGNDEQLAAYFLSNTYCFGAIINNHETNMRPDTYDVLTGPNGLNGRSSLAVYFFVDNNQVVGLKGDLGGWIFFYRDDDGLRVSFQSAYNEIYSRNLVNKITAGAAQWCGTINLAGQYTFEGYPQSVPLPVTQTPLPSGKILKYPTVESDPRFSVCRYRDYPVTMYDGIVSYSPQNRRSAQYDDYKKIRIDDKTYMHVGGLSWVQYDSIVVHNVTV